MSVFLSLALSCSRFLWIPINIIMHIIHAGRGALNESAPSQHCRFETKAKGNAPAGLLYSTRANNRTMDKQLVVVIFVIQETQQNLLHRVYRRF